MMFHSHYDATDTYRLSSDILNFSEAGMTDISFKQESGWLEDKIVWGTISMQRESQPGRKILKWKQEKRQSETNVWLLVEVLHCDG